MDVNKIFEREIGLISSEQLKCINNTLFILFGLGGVGGYTFEGLLRAGAQNIAIIDKDSFENTNMNRQLAATNDTIGKKKVEVYKNRALSINTSVDIFDIEVCINANNIYEIFNKITNHYNDFALNNLINKKRIYVIDCIDDINAKIELIKYCVDNNIKIISSMGTANHIKSTNIRIDKLSKTKYCPIAKLLRNNLKKFGNYNIQVLYFDEEPIDISKNKIVDRKISTISYIPAIAGLKLSEYVILDIINN